MNNKEDREWVLENVESINADVKDIDELCCALEHSTIFAIDYIETFATKLIDFDYEYKNQQQELERYKNIVDELEKWLELVSLQYKKKDIDDFAIYENVLRKLKELKGE